MKKSTEDLIDQYDQLWRDGDRPPFLRQFLADSRLSLEQQSELLADLVAIDMEYRWRAGAVDKQTRDTTTVGSAADSETIVDPIGVQPTLEKYLRDWPELGRSASIRSELLTEEFRARHRWGDRPSVDEFLKRFDGDERLRAELSKVLDELDRDAIETDTTPDPVASTAGESFGRYRLIRQLGKGGMGQVYLAEDTQLERTVALKMPHLGESDVIQKRFVNEAKAAALLHHPSVCPVYDAGEIDGRPFLTMAYIDGMTLRDVWQHDGKPDVHEIAAQFTTIAEAMQAAHDAGIVHRDLKSSNVMLHREGNPIVMDFGLAIRGTADDERLTQTGDAFGSPAYMSPEQIEGDYASVGHASDIYSLGVMLYEALTGSLPFTGTASLVAVRIARDEPQRPSTLCPDCPVDLERLCMRMLQKDPAMRPASMSEVVAELRESARRHRTAEPARPATRTKQVPPGNRRRANYTAALAALAIVALLAAALVIKVQTDQGEVVIKSFDPDIEVLVRRNGKPVDEITLDQDSVSTKVRTGEISIEVKGVASDGLRIKNGRFELTKGKRVVVEILPALRVGGDIANTRQGLSSLDQLRRDSITPYQRKVAGGGDAAKTPAELVAVLGDSRLQHEYRVATDVRFTSDAKTLVSCGEDGKIRFWDIATGELLREMQGARRRVLQIALSPNEQQVAALLDLGGQSALAIYDVATGQEQLRFDGGSHFLGMDWVDDQHVVCLGAGPEGLLSIRNVVTGDTLRSFASPPEGFLLVSLSADRKKLAIASRWPVKDSSRVTVFATETGERLHELPNESFTNQDIHGIAWHPSANSMVITNGAKPVHWDIASGDVDVFAERYASAGAAWAPDGSLLATADANAVTLWRPDRKTKTRRLSTLVQPARGTLRFSPDGKHIAATSHQGAVLLWNVSAGQLVEGFEGHWNAVTAVAVSQDGKHVASSSLDRTVRLWDPSTGKEKHRYIGISGDFSEFYDVAFSPDSSLLAASGRATAGLRIWDIASGRLQFKLPLPNNQEGMQVQWAADSDAVLLATNYPPSLRIYSLQSHTPKFSIQLKDRLFGADYHSGTQLLAAAAGQRVQVWQLGNNRPIHELDLEGPASSIEISDDGLTLLVAGPNFPPRLYNAAGEVSSGDPSRELPLPDEHSIVAAIFDQSGQRIATLDATRRLILWDAETLAELHRIQLPEEPVSAHTVHHQQTQRQMTFAPDNHHILVANNNGVVYVLRIP